MATSKRNSKGPKRAVRKITKRSMRQSKGGSFQWGVGVTAGPVSSKIVVD